MAFLKASVGITERWRTMVGFVCSGWGSTRHSQRGRAAVQPRGRRVGTFAAAGANGVDMTDEEVEEILKQHSIEDAGDQEKYLWSTEEGDPIADALRKMCGCKEVKSFELMDSRWNGNEAVKAMTEKGPYFVKVNRVEDPSVFMSEAIGLSTILKTNTVKCPMPIHVGKIPKVGAFGPGAFMILEWMDLLPFGASRPEAQKDLGNALADMHLNTDLENVHQGRFGFVSNNFLSLTPMDNRWTRTWPNFFARRIALLIRALFESKAYSRAPLKKTEENSILLELGQKLISNMDEHFAGCEIKPSLIHGDLWIGNAGWTKENGAVVYDPACCFGHHELDLAIMELFGGITSNFYDAYHAKIPRAEGFEHRAKLYKLYHYLNQLNLFGNDKVLVEVVKLLHELT